MVSCMAESPFRLNARSSRRFNQFSCDFSVNAIKIIEIKLKIESMFRFHNVCVRAAAVEYISHASSQTSHSEWKVWCFVRKLPFLLIREKKSNVFRYRIGQFRPNSNFFLYIFIVSSFFWSSTAFVRIKTFGGHVYFFAEFWRRCNRAAAIVYFQFWGCSNWLCCCHCECDVFVLKRKKWKIEKELLTRLSLLWITKKWIFFDRNHQYCLNTILFVYLTIYSSPSVKLYVIKCTKKILCLCRKKNTIFHCLFSYIL